MNINNRILSRIAADNKASFNLEDFDFTFDESNLNKDKKKDKASTKEDKSDKNLSSTNNVKDDNTTDKVNEANEVNNTDDIDEVNDIDEIDEVDDTDEVNDINTSLNIDNNDNRSDLEKMIAEDSFNKSFDPYQVDPTAQRNSIQLKLIENIFQSLANDGRGLLKQMENFKFRLIQAVNTCNGQEELRTKVLQKQKILESAAAQIYGIVFDLENYDLTPNYEDEQLAGEEMPMDNISEEINEDAFKDEDITELDEQESENIDEKDKDLEEDMDADDFSKSNTETDELEMQGGFDPDKLPGPEPAPDANSEERAGKG